MRVFHDVAQPLIGLAANRVVELTKDLINSPEEALPGEFLEAFENNCVWRRYLFTIRGRRDNYQGEVRAQYSMLSAVPLSKGSAAATAMSTLLKYVPNAFAGSRNSKKRCHLEANEETEETENIDPKRLKAADTTTSLQAPPVV